MSSTEAGSATSDLLRSLTDTVGALLRQEIGKARDEMTGKARQAGGGLALLGGATALGAMAAGTGAALVLRLFDRFLPPRLAAVVVTAAFSAGAVGLSTAGIRQLRELPPLMPDRTIRDIRDDIDAARQA
ncbi:phage holin family protein [Nakamurella endophytica]|uniref:Phage holin family protein n=1 Tax=Nakamurella endophytica TaxID=1748367 RepID=A0A917SMG3_9ACTN|nr:phage holin family protein [Nakamurella endophytica]GGL89324.1 hypothetical protein GCM10011594_06140 [Nakamurella endophytica]